MTGQYAWRGRWKRQKTERKRNRRRLLQLTEQQEVVLGKGRVWQTTGRLLLSIHKQCKACCSSSFCYASLCMGSFGYFRFISFYFLYFLLLSCIVLPLSSDISSSGSLYSNSLLSNGRSLAFPIIIAHLDRSLCGIHSLLSSTHFPASSGCPGPSLLSPPRCVSECALPGTALLMQFLSLASPVKR